MVPECLTWEEEENKKERYNCKTVELNFKPQYVYKICRQGLLECYLGLGDTGLLHA